MERINQMEPLIGDEEKKAMVEYLDSGGWLTEFKKTREFERVLADFVGCKHACAVNNGTVSLVIALMALGIGREAEVIVPDYTMIASAMAVSLVGASPVLVDIDPTNLCIDLDAAEKAVTTRTRAIVYVGVNGRCHEMEKVVGICQKSNLSLIEDAAQCLGSTYHGKHLGTFGEIGSLSFSPHKIVTTGQGGMLLTDNEELFKKISMVKDFGRPEAGIDYHEIIGLNSKFTDLQAVIGTEQLRTIGWRIKRKKEMYKLYQTLLSNIEPIVFIETNLADCAPWFMDILIEKAELRDELASYLGDRGIGTRPFYPAIHTQPPYSHITGDFRVSEDVSRRGLWLPSSLSLSDEDIERVCIEIDGFFKR